MGGENKAKDVRVCMDLGSLASVLRHGADLLSPCVCSWQ